MVHQPTNRNDEQILFAQVQQPPVKNTFLHYDVCASAPHVEQSVLRRHQTAPATTRGDDDDDSDDEGVTLPEPQVFGKAELKTTIVADVTPNILAKEDYPVPGSLCRHTTHDAFEHGQYAWDPNVCPGPFTEGHQNGMPVMQALPEGLPWDGQMGGQTCGVLPMTSDTVMLVSVHPPVWMPPEDANFSQVAQLPMIPLIAQPLPSQMPIDAEDQLQSGDWQMTNWSGDYYDGQLQPPSLPLPDVSTPETFEAMQGRGTANAFAALGLADPASAKALVPSAEERFWDGMGVELLHQPQKIGRSANMDHVHWVVDASKLNDKAKVLVSPEFKIPGRNGAQFSFKMVMYPKDQTSFRAAGGQGFVQLKCESDTQYLQSCSLTFRMGICNGRAGGDAKRDGPRNVVTWDFKKSLVCDHEEVKKTWNFKDVVDAKTRTFAVCIEILSVEA